MIRSIFVLVVLSCAAPSVHGAQSKSLTDKQVQAAWDKLEDKDKKQIGMWFEAEAERLDTYQNTLIKWIMGTVDHDPRDWPAADPAPLYDAAQHAPQQPIIRHFVAPESDLAKKQQARFSKAIPKRALDPAYRYDWARRSVLHCAERTDPERLFHNGLAGYPPDLDLAEALVMAALDDGSQQEALVAFSHAYADRGGNAIPGVTLYDAWASGEVLEMPDVECLGIVHDLADDWKTWKAPVSGGQQQKLYDFIGGYFSKARRHRGLRTALARTWINGNAVLRDGYDGAQTNLHALWETHSADPNSLLPELPNSKKWESWLKKWTKKVKKDRKLAAKGANRQQQLRESAQRVRNTLIGVMLEYGALKTR